MDGLQQIIFHLHWQRICLRILNIILIPALIMFSSSPLTAQIPDSEVTGPARDADLTVCERRTKFIKKGDFRTLESGWNHKLDAFLKAPMGASIKVVRYWAWFIPVSEQEQTLDGKVWKKLNLGGFKEIFSWAKMQIKVPFDTYVRYYACLNGWQGISPEISYSGYPLQQEPNTVIIYQHANYQGIGQRLEVGKYDVNQLAIGNDQLSSLRVPDGMHARLFEHAGFQGSFREITADTSYVGKQWNDRISSLWVFSEVKNRGALYVNNSEVSGDMFGEPTFAGTSLDSLMLAPNGTRFGGWLLNTADNVIEGMADLDGDGADEIVITSPWGIGVLAFTGTSLDSLMLAPNGTRFGGWLLNTADNVIEGMADLDGDGADEIVITSPWGIGVLAFTGTSLDSLMLAPNGTRFGGWLLNTADNVIEGMADLDGDGADEIVITSPWGIGVLAFTGTSLESLMLAPNGTRFGGWLLNTADNVIEGMADLDGDGADEIVITSPWGIGVLAFTGTSLDSLMLAPNGTRFGGWLLNTDDNTIEGLADMDRDGADDIVITSPWGIGVLAFTGTSLDSLMLAPNGTRFGGWLLNTDDNTIEGLADMDRDGADDIVITSPWGIGVLAFTGTSLDSLMLAPNGTRFGGWLLNTDDNTIEGLADMDRDGADDIVITSPWGIGVLR